MSTLTEQAVLEFLERNPDKSNKRDIARGLGVKGEDRVALRQILKKLEADGTIARTGKRAFAAVDAPPPTCVIKFERVDDMGDLIGRVHGRDGAYGPDIVYAGPSSKKRKETIGVGDRALCRVDRAQDGTWYAKSIKKFDRTTDVSLIGLYEANRHGGLVKPTSRKDKREYIVEFSDANGAETGDIVRLTPKKGKPYGPQRGVVTEIVGKIDDPRAASIVAMHTHDIPDEFAPSIIADAEAAEAAETPREDLTQIPLITIDPADARDHDDAVFARPDDDPQNKDGWVVIVAIADVAAYVRHGTALDDEAFRRGNSTYFPDRVSPMLPECLSADQCSLKELEFRETFAVEMRFSNDGTKIGHRFIRGTMRSAAKLSYEQAQSAIDGKPDDKSGPLLETVLKPLWEAYYAVGKARKRRNPLELDIPERRVLLTEDGAVGGVFTRERFDAHKLIEEFMIQANVCAAETLEEKRSGLLYRIHEEPSDEKVIALGNFLPTIGMSWAKGQGKTSARFNALLEKARMSEHEHLVSEMVLRSQSQARYADENFGHFGLNLAKYAHFTSPIRRYSDLIVHRALIRALDLGPEGLTDEEMVRLEEIAEHLTMTERRSMAAERDASDRYLAAFMADKVGAEFGGRISGVTKAGLFVRLNDSGADGFIPAAHLSSEYWVYDEAHAALVGDKSGRRYELGMEVEVRLIEATPINGGLLFEMLSNPRARRKDLKAPSREETRAHRAPRKGRPGGPGGGPAKHRRSKPGRPANVRLGKKKK